MTATIDAPSLKEWLHDGREIALLDVREQGQFGLAHLFYAIPLPYSRLELEIPRLVPRRTTRIVVCDDGELGVAQRAAARLAKHGYTNVRVLDGGTGAWAQAGLQLFAGVNVPSKTFGELAEHHYHTPRLQAAEVAAMLRAGSDVALLDGRPLSEYRKMTIPGSRCCPNGELAYRFREMVPNPATPVVINCAGRTRSIIGAQTLINLGIPNPVYALENGTQGWYLEDHALEHGADRRYPDVARDADVAALCVRARDLAEQHGARHVDAAEVDGWLADAGRTTYLCDVRTAEEFAAGSVAGAQHAPGGQLIQATDQWIAVRNARVVLVDAEGVRAPVIASWLAQMGHEAYVLSGGTAAKLKATDGKPIDLPLPPAISVSELVASIEHYAIIDLRSSMAYRAGHIAGARWSIRPRLESVTVRGRVVLVADEPGVAAIAASDLARAGVGEIRFLLGGMAAWESAGQATERTTASPTDAERIDYLFFVHDRHDGNKDAARQYLAWETNLISQIDASERAGFRFGMTNQVK